VKYVIDSDPAAMQTEREVDERLYESKQVNKFTSEPLIS